MTSKAVERELSPPSRFAVRFIETYRLQAAQRLGARCRFQPSCSSYGLEAFQRYGFWKASARTLWRLLRCNPSSKGPRLDPP